MKLNRLVLLSTVMVLMLIACALGSALQTHPPSEMPWTESPSTGTPATDGPPAVTEPPSSLSVEDQLAQVDTVLRKSARASIAYNACRSSGKSNGCFPC